MDEIDIASEAQQTIDNAVINNIRLRAAEIPAGVYGECDDCGFTFTRLVGGLCGRCRDIRAKVNR